MEPQSTDAEFRLLVVPLEGDLRLSPESAPLDGACVVQYEERSEGKRAGEAQRVAVALSWWRGRKAEFWIDVQNAPVVLPTGDFQAWLKVFDAKGCSSGRDVAARSKLRGWTKRIVQAVLEHTGSTFDCMVGHLAGVNERLYRETLRKCLEADLEPEMARAIAAGSTAFYKTRWRSGYQVVDLYDGKLGVWIRMFRHREAHAELERSEPLYDGVDFAPEQDEFELLPSPESWPEIPGVSGPMLR